MLEPERQALIEHRIDRAVADRLQAARIAWPAVQLQAAAPALDVLHRKTVDAERLVDEIARRMRGVLARRNAKRNALRLDLGERLDADARVHHEGEAIPGRIVRHDAQGQRLLEQSLAAHRLRQHRRRIDDRRLELAARHRMREDRRAAGHAQPRFVRVARAAADGDADVAVAVIRRRRIAGDVQADFPQKLGADEVRALW